MSSVDLDQTTNVDSSIITASIVLGLSSFIIGSVIVLIVLSIRNVSKCNPFVPILSFIFGVLMIITFIAFFKLFSKYSSTVNASYNNIFC